LFDTIRKTFGSPNGRKAQLRKKLGFSEILQVQTAKQAGEY